MIVYRVEHVKNRHGPYKQPDGLLAERYGISACSSDKRPMPYSDGLLNTPSTHRFGFGDTKSVKSWFSKRDRKNLFKHGFVCRVYKVPRKHVRLGKKQLTFNHGHATFVRLSRTLHA